MEKFNLLAFLLMFSLMLLGAIAHWVHKKVRKEVRGSIVDYLIADYPGRSMSVLFVLLSSAGGVAFTAYAALVDPLMLWHELVNTGSVPEVSVVAIVTAVQAGWSFDSGINKGNRND